MEINEAVSKLNQAIEAAGYRREEARATAWEKETPNGKLARIYLNGKKAAGFISVSADGSMKYEKVSFVKLVEIINNVFPEVARG